MINWRRWMEEVAEKKRMICIKKGMRKKMKRKEKQEK